MKIKNNERLTPHITTIADNHRHAVYAFGMLHYNQPLTNDKILSKNPSKTAN